ncbi:hypothetical protein K1X12_14545 [Hyphomonas sp. WL0036]|uniref:hypothetical protein n=1 Tax=Hyphomonas sediminis TaxID=2866160 RepID=UPI001C805689|nr:hypothetical protein [Hyphomonas sediminis]MBY9068127.1 hypothetical protein [Hyphomonas sediminis]
MLRFVGMIASLAAGLLFYFGGAQASAQEASGTPDKAFPGNIFKPDETAFPGNIFEPDAQAFPGNIFDPGAILFPGNIFDLVASVDEAVFALAQAAPDDRDALNAVYDRRSDLRKQLGEIAALCQQGYTAGAEARIGDAGKMQDFQRRFTSLAKQRVTTPENAQAWLKEAHAATQALILFQKEVDRAGR